MIDLPPTPDLGDPLAQPTRRRLFSALADAGAAMTTGELAAALGLHPNGIRVHLGRLADDGLVVRERSLGARGRPADAWRLAPDARPAGRAPSAYEDLCRWLARSLLPAADRGAERLELTGHEIGRELSVGCEAGPAGLIDRLAALGFRPELRRADAQRQTIALCNCPYRAAVRENQPAICALHRGLTTGLLEQLSPRAELERFEPRDPDEAGCELVVTGLPTTASVSPASSPGGIES